MDSRSLFPQRRSGASRLSAINLRSWPAGRTRRPARPLRPSARSPAGARGCGRGAAARGGRGARPGAAAGSLSRRLDVVLPGLGGAGLRPLVLHRPRLAREGLAAYARHPLLRAVGVDRTHYAPVEAMELAEYREQVPEEFRFLVKAHEACTLARFPDHARYGAAARPGEYRSSSTPVTPRTRWWPPSSKGSGSEAGALLFQFAPQSLGSPRALRRARSTPSSAPCRAGRSTPSSCATASWSRPSTATPWPPWAPATATTSTPACRTSAPRHASPGSHRGPMTDRPLAAGSGHDLRGGGPPLRPLQPHGRAGPRQPPAPWPTWPARPWRRGARSSARSTTTPRGARRCRRWSWRETPDHLPTSPALPHRERGPPPKDRRGFLPLLPVREGGGGGRRGPG